MKRIAIYLTSLAWLTLAHSVSAQEERIALDWIFSDEGKTSMSVPRRAWAGPMTIALYDTKTSKADRTIELLNPHNGRRRSIDAEDALADV